VHKLKPLQQSVVAILKKNNHLWTQNHEYSKRMAFSRVTQKYELSEQERDYVFLRTKNVHTRLEELLGQPIDLKAIPRIGFCFSGGGFRAMVSTLGFLKGAQQIGLLDCCTYMAGLSGSAWALAPWIASGKSIDTYLNELHYKIENGIGTLYKPWQAKQVCDLLITKMFNRQLLSTVDIYGPLLANTLLTDLGENSITRTFTKTHKKVKKGIYPLPLYTALATNKDPYEWIEFSPFHIQNCSNAPFVSIPIWSFGRSFKKGISQNYSPEQTLGYFLGIYGSAFGVDMHDIIQILNTTISNMDSQLPDGTAHYLQRVLQTLADGPLDEMRLIPSMLPNFMYEIANTRFEEHKRLTLVDAGIDFNLPLAPLLNTARDLDIIIVYDASTTVRNGKHLLRAARYAQVHELPFPDVVNKPLGRELITVLKSQLDPEAPIIVYMPRIANPAYGEFDPENHMPMGFCATLNFTYSAEQIDMLSGLPAFTVQEQSQVIFDVIKDVIEQKTARLIV